MSFKTTVLFLSLVLGLCGYAAEENLIANPEMKGISSNTGLPASWQKKMVFGLETVCDFKASEGPDGKPAVSLEWKNGGPRFGVGPDLKKIKPGGKSFVFSALSRANGGSAAVLIAEAYDKTGKIVAEWKSAPLLSSSWTKLELFFNVPVGADGFSVSCFNEGQGTVCFSSPSLLFSSLQKSAVFPMQAFCMPVEISKVIYGGKAEFNTFANAPVPLSFIFKGNTVSGKVNAFVIEIPADMRVTEAFNGHPSLPQKEQPDIENITRDGIAYRRYSFKDPATFRIVKPVFSWGRELRLGLLPEKADAAGKIGKVYWYLKAGALTSEEQSFVVNILPPMPHTPNPGRFGIMLWSLNDLDFPSPDILASIAAIYEEAGMNLRPRSSGKIIALDSLFEKRGWKMGMTMVDYMHSTFTAGGVGWDSLKNKVEFIVRENGKIDKDRICPQYFINDSDFRTYLKNRFAARLREVALKNGEPVYLDNEPWEPMEWCFCDRCRNDFAAYCKLDKVPDVSGIKSRYRKEWRDFRCLNTMQAIKIHHDVVRKAYPDSKIIDYDYAVRFENPDFRNLFYSVAKDPLLNEKYLDGHISSYYHYIDKNAFDMIDMNVKNLKKDYWTIGAIDRSGDYLSAKEVLTPGQCRMLILASAASGAKGSGFFPGRYIDGKFILSIDRAMAEIAALESFYMDGRRIDEEFKVTGLPYFSRKLKSGEREIEIIRPNWKDFLGYRAHVLDGVRLVTVFNYNRDLKLFSELSVKLPSGDYTVLDPVSNKRILSGNGKQSWTSDEISKGFLVDVLPGDVRFIIIRPFSESDTALPVTAADSVARKDFDAACRSFSDAPVLPDAVAADGLSIDYDDVDNDGRIELKMSGPGQKLWINIECGGILTGWEADGSMLCNPVEKLPADQRGMCWDFFWLPANLRHNGSESAPVKIEKISVCDGKASVVLKNTLKEADIDIFKTYEIRSAENGFRISYDIRNSGKSPVSFSFWSHNFSGFGKNTMLQFKLADGIKMLGMEKGSFAFARLADSHPGFNKINGVIAENIIMINSPRAKYDIFADFEFSKLNVFYVWNQSRCTFEWMYDETTLVPGKNWHTVINYVLMKK